MEIVSDSVCLFSLLLMIKFDDIRRGRDIGFGERISANVVKVLLAGQLSCVQNSPLGGITVQHMWTNLLDLGGCT